MVTHGSCFYIRNIVYDGKHIGEYVRNSKRHRILTRQTYEHDYQFDVQARSIRERWTISLTYYFPTKRRVYGIIMIFYYYYRYFVTSPRPPTNNNGTITIILMYTRIIINTLHRQFCYRLHMPKAKYFSFETIERARRPCIIITAVHCARARDRVLCTGGELS